MLKKLTRTAMMLLNNYDFRHLKYQVAMKKSDPFLPVSGGSDTGKINKKPYQSNSYGHKEMLWY